MTSLTLKVKTKDSEQIISDLTSSATVDELKRKLASCTGIRADRLNVLVGFPPKKMDLSDAARTLDACGIRNGIKLIVDEAAAPATPSPPSGGPTAAAAVEFEHESIDNGFSAGILLKKVVPSDNSCLFTSIGKFEQRFFVQYELVETNPFASGLVHPGYLLNGRIDTECGQFMRQIIATTVAKDLETYSPAYLGKTNEEYCEWILKSESWGGAIEVSILSQFYGIEIAVVDIINGIINHFGEDQKFGCRSFLLYDGIHYDPLYLEQMVRKRLGQIVGEGIA